MDDKKNINEGEEKTVLLDDGDEKTVLLDDGNEKTVPSDDGDEKTVLLNDGDEKTVLLDDGDEKTVLLDDGDEKTVLLNEEGERTVRPDEEGQKTEPLDEDSQKTVLPDEEGQKTEPLDEDGQKTEMPDKDDRKQDHPSEDKDAVITDRPADADGGISQGAGHVSDTTEGDVKLHQLPLGSNLNNRYTIENVIGEGGFGITYKGYDTKLDIPVAIKEYFPQSMVMRDTSGARGNTVTPYGGRNKELYEKYLSRFYSEARTLAKLQSIPGIVRVQDYFTENDTAYIVMEYVDGKNLKEYAKEKGGRISCDEALTLFHPVAEALSELHKHDILHRDISPDNIMVTKEGKVTLIDLGASRELGDDQRTMTVLLKPGYSSLEQYTSGASQGPYSDLYSFCASFYRVITGKTPQDAMERLNNDTLIAPSVLGINIDPNIEKALLKGLSVKADDRYQSMDVLNDVLYRGKAPEPLPKPQGTDKPSPPDIGDLSGTDEPEPGDVKKRGKIPIVIIAGAALAGLVTFLIVFLNMSNQNSVVIVDSNGNTIEVAQTDPSGTGSTDPAQATEHGKKDIAQINVPPITQRSAQADPAAILHDGGTVTGSGQRDTFEFVTPREGRYRVEVSGMPSSMSVDLAFIDPKGETVAEEKGCRNGNGVTVKYLEPNTTYKIQVDQNSGTGNYDLDVGVQKPTPDITGLTRIDDSVEYTDQRNLYNFEVPRDGTYRFELSGLVSGTDTSMFIFDDPGNKISQDDNCINGEGLTLADVKAGTIYEIQVRQNNGYSGYSLNIGQQKDRVNIANNTYVTDSMEFTDQCNIYSFNATSSGSVTFTLSEMPSDMSVEMHVTDINGNKVASEVNCRNDGGLSIKDVASGTHYNVEIVQSTGKGSYALTAD